jgi:hypothetical protein
VPHNEVGLAWALLEYWLRRRRRLLALLELDRFLWLFWWELYLHIHPTHEVL